VIIDTAPEDALTHGARGAGNEFAHARRAGLRGLVGVLAYCESPGVPLSEVRLTAQQVAFWQDWQSGQPVVPLRSPPSWASSGGTLATTRWIESATGKETRRSGFTRNRVTRGEPAAIRAKAGQLFG